MARLDFYGGGYHWNGNPDRGYDSGCLDREICKERKRYEGEISTVRQYNNNAWGSAEIATVRTDSIYEAYTEFCNNRDW